MSSSSLSSCSILSCCTLHKSRIFLFSSCRARLSCNCFSYCSVAACRRLEPSMTIISSDFTISSCSWFCFCCSASNRSKYWLRFLSLFKSSCSLVDSLRCISHSFSNILSLFSFSSNSASLSSFILFSSSNFRFMSSNIVSLSASRLFRSFDLSLTFFLAIRPANILLNRSSYVGWFSLSFSWRRPTLSFSS